MLQVVEHAEAWSEDNATASDNAVSALGKLCKLSEWYMSNSQARLSNCERGPRGHPRHRCRCRRRRRRCYCCCCCCCAVLLLLLLLPLLLLLLLL